ncbi:hypothetical protein VNO78_03467 [Psophocarpus tetragonolobus]|uniref:Uncharacterized protein n=1 Tax=Psophocarpus tetragonolobus TaxID=3891 RepID=A0AAN9XVY9_PSOTE
MPKTKANVIFCTLIIYSVPQLNENIHHQIFNWTALQCYYPCQLPFELELNSILRLLELNMEIMMCRFQTLPSMLEKLERHKHVHRVGETYSGESSKSK